MPAARHLGHFTARLGSVFSQTSLDFGVFWSAPVHVVHPSNQRAIRMPGYQFRHSTLSLREHRDGRMLWILLLTLVSLAGNTGWAIPGVDPAPVPKAPKIADQSDEPAKSATTFGMPEGFVVELFAAEPDVANPVAFSIDERGRVFVCESFRQNQGVTDNRKHDRTWVEADLAAQTVEDRRAYHLRLLGDKVKDYELQDDRIRLLVDADRNGRADSATVFAEGFNSLLDGTAAGILARRGDLFLTCIPSLYRLRDENGDGVADKTPGERAILSTGYGVRVALRGHDLHGLILGPDGRLYFTIGDRGYRLEHDGRVDHDPGSGAVFRCEPDGRNLEVFARSLRNPQELAFDDLGNLFTVDNNSDGGDKARVVHLVPGSESGWNMSFQYLDDRGPWSREKIWHTACDGQPAWTLPPLAHLGAGPSGMAAYPGTGLTSHFDDRFLLADFHGGAPGSSVRSFRVRPDGATFRVCDEEETFRHILATDVEFGPDGAVWVSDWVHGWDGEGKGRLWRFRPKDQDAKVVDEVRSLLAGDWEAIEPGRLLGLLGHADRRVRLEAQWELARRRDTASFATLLGETATPLLARVHAVQGLGQILRMEKEQVVDPLIEASASPDWELRMVAARALGDCPPAGTRRADVRAALGRRLSDGHPHVQVAAATALGQLGHRLGDDPAIGSELIALAERNADADRTLRHAAVIGIAGGMPAEALESLLGHPSASLRMVACLVLRRRADDRIVRLLDDPDEAIVVEAARAIHDIPLSGCLAALASRAGSGPANEAFLRRAVSAAEQVGTSATARELVRVIDREDASQATRLEAVDALRAWKNPPKVNRVTGAWLPLATPRDAAPAREALRDAMASLVHNSAKPRLDESLRSALLTAASSLGIDGVGPLLAAWCDDASCSAASRAKALDALFVAGNPDVLGIADRLIADDEPLVRTAARRVRASKNPTAAIVPDLVSACGGDDLEERQAAVGLLASISEPSATAAIGELHEKLLAGNLDPTIALEVREAARVRLGEAAASRPAVATDPLAEWSDLLVGGNAQRGRDIFLKKTEVSCLRCHAAEGSGGNVGPKLDGIAATRDARYLLEAIVLPNARVAEGYRTTIIVTDEGRTVSGIVIGEDDGFVRLRNADGKEERVAVGSIEDRTSGPSSMPADLAAKLTRRELRDLVAWLQGLR